MTTTDRGPAATAPDQVATLADITPIDERVSDVETDLSTRLSPEGLSGTIASVTSQQVPDLVAAGIDSPANALAPTAWVGLTEPRVIGLGGKVYVGTTGDANELYIEEYSERETDGPLWHRRYFIGYAPNSVTKDDHNNPAVIIRPGKPALTIYSGHSEDNVLRWKKSAVNIEQGIQLGEERRLELAVTDRTAYANCHVHGNNIWIFHRTGNLANFWALSKSTDWGESFTHVGKIISAPKQFYVSGAVSGDVLRIVSAGHPTIADDHNLYYAEINLVTGAITKSDGTVLGNLDGTNLPIAQTSMELIATPASGQVISEAIVSNTPNRQIAYTMANPGSIGSTGRYYYAVRAGSSWMINPVRYVGDQGTGASWGAAHFPTAPVAPNVLYLTRKSGATWQILRVTTPDNGATWTEEIIESAPITTTQAWPIDALDGTTLGIEALASQIRSYVGYTNWDGSVRPFPTTRPVSRWQPLGDTADRPQPLAYSRVGLYLPGISGNYVTTPDTPALSPSDGIRFMVDAALDDWSNGAQQALIARYGFGGARSVKFFMNGDGKPGVSWSADGTAAADLIPGTILPFADGERWQVRCDLIPAFNATNYLAKFWYRRPGERAWRAHSTTSVSSTVRGIFDSSDPWEIGSRAGGTTDRVKGTIFTAAIQTIGGTVLAEYRADSGTAKYRDSKGSIFTINGSDSAFTATA